MRRKKPHQLLRNLIGAAAWPEDLATMEEVKASKSQVRIGIDVLAPITKNLADYLSR